MKRRDYIPYKDPEFDSFQDNFIKQVSLHKAEWAIEGSFIEALLPLQEKWKEKWNLAKVKTTATLTMIASKNNARNMYEKKLRNFIQRFIYHNNAVSPDDIILCGLEPYNTNKKEIAATTKIPLLLLTQPDIFSLIIRFYNSRNDENVLKKGKTREFSYLEMVYKINSQPVNPEDCNKRLVLTKWYTKLIIENEQRGNTWWFYARWVNRRGVAGPWTIVDSIQLW